MAINSIANRARGQHVSPGVYMKERDIQYVAQSLGITTLGLVGETLRGPAFKATETQSWGEFVDYFGGTSPTKFRESNYPKYELPYIAKSYLTESHQLSVTRVLGLSGYNAGPCWLISASGATGNMVVAVLRSRGHYEKIAKTGSTTNDDPCNTNYLYDHLVFDTESITMEPYMDINMMVNCGDAEPGTAVTNTYMVGMNNYGKFTLVVTLTNGDVVRYPVSFNPGSVKDYIITVLGSTPDDGSAPIFVEELYDVALQQQILAGNITAINSTISKFEQIIIKPVGEPVLDFITTDEAGLTRNNVGQRFVASEDSVSAGFTYHAFDPSTNQFKTPVNPITVKIGGVYVVRPYNNNGRREYYYSEAFSSSVDASGATTYTQEMITTGSTSGVTTGQIFILNYDRYFMLGSGGSTVVPVACDFNDYKEQYRSAMTPWFVSQLHGDGENIELNKLFRFHTISDGDYANQEVKISIENIKPDEGLFDVVVRNYNDSDYSVNVYERFSKCTMQEGNPNYVGLKIGTHDGDYESKSKYVQIEVIANDVTARSVPCGFLGYPMRAYDGIQPNGTTNTANLIPPVFAYNEYFDEEIKVRRQYFGLSDIIGVDYDALKYKGKDAYDEYALDGYTPGFHLDSRLNELNSDIINMVSVDGIQGYKWETTSPNSVTNLNMVPIIGTEDDMFGTIYENVGVRKFTAYPYGGFDGWDIYRGYRTNTDEFSVTKYRAPINTATGVGENFSRIMGAEELGLTGNTITSDYYAYLAGIKQYTNPMEIDINVFATPGIDYVNNKMLVDETIDMIEERADAIYIPTTPDKEFGKSDAMGDMYTPQEVVNNFEDSDIDTSYAATYYPWIKFYDNENSKYINLPPTKDVVRNFAFVDNKYQPWYAPAGFYRGNVDCTKLHISPDLEGQDILYDGSINPLVKFPEGEKIWGNKTMYKQDTPLNRINVRRLMIRLKKLISVAAIKLIFDPNDLTVKNQFLSIVIPILDTIKSNRGIIDYRISVDDSVEARDRHELPASIQVKPTQSLEYIDINFTIMPEGVVFEGE